MIAQDHPKPTAWLVGIFLRIFPVLSAIGKQELDSVLGLASWPSASPLAWADALAKKLKPCFWRVLASSDGSFLLSKPVSYSFSIGHVAMAKAETEKILFNGKRISIKYIMFHTPSQLEFSSDG
jgi:hypothetical protein